MSRQLRIAGASELRARAHKSKLISAGQDFASDDLFLHPPCSKCKRRLICRGCDKLLCGDCGYILQCQRCLLGWPTDAGGYPEDKSTQYYARDTGRQDDGGHGQIIADLQEKLDLLVDRLANTNVKLKSEHKARLEVEKCIASLIDSRFKSLVEIDEAKKEVQHLQLVLTRTIVHHSNTMQSLLGENSVINCKPTFQAWRRLTLDNRMLSRIAKVQKINAEQDALLVHAKSKAKSQGEEISAKHEEIYRLRSKLRRAARNRLTALFNPQHSVHACFSAWRSFRKPDNRKASTFAHVVISAESDKKLSTLRDNLAVKVEECDYLKSEVARLKREAVSSHISMLQGDQVRVLQSEILRMTSRF